MKYYIHVLKNYATFTGRARRSEYWYFVLFNFLFTIAASILDNILGTTIKREWDYHGMPLTFSNGYIQILYSLFVLVPNLAVSVRRLHDVGKSGWFIFLALIPIIGWIWIIVLLCTDSMPGENEYGPNPKGEVQQAMN